MQRRILNRRAVSTLAFALLAACSASESSSGPAGGAAAGAAGSTGAGAGPLASLQGTWRVTVKNGKDYKPESSVAVVGTSVKVLLVYQDESMPIGTAPDCLRSIHRDEAEGEMSASGTELSLSFFKHLAYAGAGCAAAGYGPEKRDAQGALVMKRIAPGAAPLDGTWEGSYDSVTYTATFSGGNWTLKWQKTGSATVHDLLGSLADSRVETVSGSELGDWPFVALRQ